MLAYSYIIHGRVPWSKGIIVEVETFREAKVKLAQSNFSNFLFLSKNFWKELKIHE
jgi:hypothetical protein